MEHVSTRQSSMQSSPVHVELGGFCQDGKDADSKVDEGAAPAIAGVVVLSHAHEHSPSGMREQFDWTTFA
jgi:hypothetical protein